MSADEPYDPGPAIEALADAGIDFVLIGGLAGIAHGSAYPTYDLDVMYARDRANLERIRVAAIKDRTRRLSRPTLAR